MTKKTVFRTLDIALLALLAMFVIGVVSVVVTWHHIEDVLRDRYTAMDVGYLIVAYLDQNEGAWPTSWEALETVEGASGQAVDTAWMAERVSVDWDADPALIAESEEPVVVVRCFSGRPPGPNEMHDANNVIWRYLRDALAEEQTEHEVTEDE